VGYQGWAVVAAEGQASERTPAAIVADARDEVARLMQALRPAAVQGR
jgi:hypothetical protein